MSATRAGKGGALAIVLHTHMQPSGKPEVVQFQVGIRFADKAPERHPVMMRIGMALNYAGGFAETVEELADYEKAGLEIVFVPEAYSFDAISQVGYLAAKTERVEIGTGIVNVYSRVSSSRSAESSALILLTMVRSRERMARSPSARSAAAFCLAISSVGAMPMTSV